MSSGVVEIRRARPEDVAELIALRQGIEQAPHWSERIWLESLAGSKADVASESEGQASPGVRRLVLMALQDNLAVGFLVLSVVGEIAEVESVGVATASRRMGVARALLLRGIAWAMENRAEAIELEVRASNLAAIALYVALGYKEQGRRRGYYSEPPEDAVLMRLQLQRLA